MVVALAGLTVPSHAAPARLLVCEARGALTFDNPYPSDQTWTISGVGRCVGVPSGAVYSVRFSGFGATGGFGCEINPLEAYASGLPTFSVNLTLSQASVGSAYLTQYWTPDPVPVSNYPGGGLFLVSRDWVGETTIGAGALVTRPLLLCPPSGSDDTVFAWSFRP